MSMNFWEEVEPASSKIPISGEFFIDTEAGYIALVDSGNQKVLCTSSDNGANWTSHSARVNNIIALFMDHETGKLYCLEDNFATITVFYFDTADGNIYNLTTTGITNKEGIRDIFVYNGELFVLVYDERPAIYLEIYKYSAGWTFINDTVIGLNIDGGMGVVTEKGYYYSLWRQDTWDNVRVYHFNGLIWVIYENEFIGEFSYFGSWRKETVRTPGMVWDGGNYLLFTGKHNDGDSNHALARLNLAKGEGGNRHCINTYERDMWLVPNRLTALSYKYTSRIYAFKDKQTYIIDAIDMSLKEDADLSPFLTNNLIAWSGFYAISSSGEILKWVSASANSGVMDMVVNLIKAEPTTATILVDSTVDVIPNNPVQLNDLRGEVAFKGLVQTRKYNGEFYEYNLLSYDKEMVIPRFSHVFVDQTVKQMMEYILTNYANWLDFSNSIDPNGDFTTTYSLEFINCGIKEAFDMLIDLEDGVWLVNPKGIVYAHALTEVDIVGLGLEGDNDVDHLDESEFGLYYSSESINTNYKSIVDLEDDGWVFTDAIWDMSTTSGHKYVVRGFHLGGGTSPSAKSPTGFNQSSGTIDVWIIGADSGGTARSRYWLRDSSNNVLVRMEFASGPQTDSIRVWNGVSEQSFNGNNCGLYHISINFNSGSKIFNWIIHCFYSGSGAYVTSYSGSSYAYNNGSAGNFDHMFFDHTTDYNLNYFNSPAFSWDSDYFQGMNLNPWDMGDVIAMGYWWRSSSGNWADPKDYVKVIESWDDDITKHKGCIQIHQETWGGGYDRHHLFYFPPFSATNGTIEGWIWIPPEDKSLEVVIGGGRIRLWWDEDTGDHQWFKIWDGAYTSYTYYENQWVYIVVDFECGSDNYKGLSADTYNLYMQGKMVIENAPFLSGASSFTEIYIETAKTNDVNYDVYLDGWRSTFWGNKPLSINTHTLDEKSGFVTSVPEVTEMITKYNTVHLYGAYVAGSRLENDIAGGRGVDTADVAINGTLEYIDHYPHINSQALIDDLADAILARTGFADNPIYVKIEVAGLSFVLCGLKVRFAFTDYPNVNVPDMYYILANKYDLIADIQTFNVCSGLIQAGLEYSIDVQKTADSDEEQLDIIAATPEVAGDETPQLFHTFTAAVSLADRDLCYINDSGKMAKAQGNAKATCDTLLAMCVETISADAEGRFLLWGKYAIPSLTTGAEYFVSPAIAGDITITKPSATGNIIRKVGTALSTTVLFFNPSQDYLQSV